MPAKTVSIEKEIKSNLRTANDLISEEDLNNVLERLNDIRYELGNLGKDCVGINLPEAYDELDGIIKDLNGYLKPKENKPEENYSEDPKIKTVKDVLDALTPKIDSRAAIFDEPILTLVNSLYDALTKLK